MVHFGPGQFEKFEQIWGTVNTNGTTTLKFKKRFENSICSYFICLLTYCYMYPTCKISKCIPVEVAGGAKLE